MFEQVWGPGSLDCVKDVSGTYERIARAIAAYERAGGDFAGLVASLNAPPPAVTLDETDEEGDSEVSIGFP